MLQTPERTKETTEETPRVEERESVFIPEARLIPPARKRNRWTYLVAGLIGVAILAVAAFLIFAGDDARSPGSGGTAAVEEAEAMQIQTASGTFSISDVVVGDRYPEGCADTDMSCNIAAPGYQMLVVQLTPEGTADVDDIMSEGKEAYITAADGTRTESFLYGWSLGESESKEGMVGFTPEAAGQGFTLHWPGNDPVALEQ